MENLTANELKILNQLSNVRDPNVDLGTLVNARTQPHPTFGTPVKWVAASKALTIGGVVVHQETITIGSDVYEFLTDAFIIPSDPDNIAVDISASAVKASVTLTVDIQPTSGNTMTIGTKVYTFVPVGTDTADGEISIGADLAEAQANIVAAINGLDEFNEPHPLVTCGDFASDDADITALIGGTIGNAIASTETFSAGTNVFSAVALSGGTNCSAQDAIDALLLSVEAMDTQGVGAVDSTGGVVTFTADEAGEAGNEIAISEDMANGAFAGGATALSGGVDGDEVFDGRLMVDDSYLYVYMGTDWRKIDLGNAY